MPNYGYSNSGNSGSSNQNSFSNSSSGGSSDSISMSNSAYNSNANSSSESGQAWSQDQLNRINSLYPGLLKDYQSAKEIDPWSKYLSDVGGTPTSFAPVDPYPTITRGGVLTPEQIQSGQNNIWSQALQGAAGQNLNTTAKMAAAGYGGANSPGSLELQGRATGLARAGAANASTQFGLNAAEKNAQQRLAAEQADVGRSTSLNAANLARSQGISEDDLRRRQVSVGAQGQQMQYNLGRQSALLQALAYYNQPLQYAKSKSSNQSSGGAANRIASKIAGPIRLAIIPDGPAARTGDGGEICRMIWFLFLAALNGKNN